MSKNMHILLWGGITALFGYYCIVRLLHGHLEIFGWFITIVTACYVKSLVTGRSS